MKARLLHLICIFILHFSIYAQENGTSLSDSGFKYYLASDYKKALPYYLNTIKVNEQKHNDFYHNNIIGECYSKIGNYDTAIFYYKQALNKFIDTVNIYQWGRNSCFSIADCYYKLSQLDSCKTYLDKTKNWKRGYPLHGYSPAFHQNLYHLYMKYYNEKNKLDSAINVFIPWAFDEWTDNTNTYLSTEHSFENDYHCKVVDFINLLKNKFTVTEIKRELNETIKKVSCDFAFEREDSYKGEIENVYCENTYTFFFGVKLNLRGSCSYYKKKDKSFSIKKQIKERKQYAIDYIIKSSLFYSLFESGCIPDKPLTL